MSSNVRLTTDAFIEKATKVHGEFFDYSKVDYLNSKTAVTICCPLHGEYNQVPYTHLTTTGCPSCGRVKANRSMRNTKEDFLRLAKDAHGELYDYENTVYSGANSRVAIRCPLHGVFEQVAVTHTSGHGCPSCSDELETKRRLQKSANDFEPQSIRMHGGKYDYSKVVYMGAQSNVTIGCPQHGFFEQTPNSHKRGKGCPHCAKTASPGWDSKSWKLHGDRSKGFVSYKLYLIHLEDEHEAFLKIGKTYLDMIFRVSKFPYPVKKVIQIVEGSAEYITYMENKFKSKYADRQYSPKREFAGKHECFQI